jgi:hypothetical protein
MPKPSAPMPNDWTETQQAMQRDARAVLHQIGPSGALEEVNRITAWRCLTCGWIEAAQECLGICVRNRVDFVAAAEFDDVRSQYDQEYRQVAELAAVVRQFAWVTPRPDKGKLTWRSLRSSAQTALAH